jgi:hypothetical protein
MDLKKQEGLAWTEFVVVRNVENLVFIFRFPKIRGIY